jgi:hypothetical protein
MRLTPSPITKRSANPSGNIGEFERYQPSTGPVKKANIAHGDGVGYTKCASNDDTQLTERSGRVNLTKGVKECEYIHGFSFVFGVEIPKLYRKSHFYATFNWRRCCVMGTVIS